MGTLPETKSYLPEGRAQKETITFQPSIFRCKNVSFREGRSSNLTNKKTRCATSHRKSKSTPKKTKPKNRNVGSPQGALKFFLKFFFFRHMRLQSFNLQRCCFSQERNCEVAFQKGFVTHREPGY